MIKKIISIITILACVFSLASCGAKNEQDITQAEDTKASETETLEQPTDKETETVTQETAEETATAKPEKIYLDATDEDFDSLIYYYESLSVCCFLRNGFIDENAPLSYIMPAVKEYIYLLYGDKKENIEYGGYPAPRYHGLVTFEIDYSFQNDETVIENRRKVDPLLRFQDPPSDSIKIQGDKWYDSWFYSIDAETVEWMLTELFGATPDREQFISDAYTGISCYYFDGRYYFQDPGGYGGGGFDMRVKSKERDADGKYTIIIEEYAVDTGSDEELYATDKTTVALIEKNGEKFWKIFSIDWDKNHF